MILINEINEYHDKYNRIDYVINIVEKSYLLF